MQPSVVAGKELVGPLPLTDEEWREYDFLVKGDEVRIYRIKRPVELYYRIGGTTHRVVDSEGITHCVPIPGSFGCVLRWKSSKGVSF